MAWPSPAAGGREVVTVSLRVSPCRGRVVLGRSPPTTIVGTALQWKCFRATFFLLEGLIDRRRAMPISLVEFVAAVESGYIEGRKKSDDAAPRPRLPTLIPME